LPKIHDYSLAENKNQSAIYRACVIDRIKRVAVRAGRKFGKTFVSSRIARDWAAAAKPGEIVLIAAPEYAYLRDQNVPELIAAIPAEMLKGGSWGTAYNKSEHILTMANDVKIFLRSMDNPDAVRPLSVAAFVGEEFSLWSKYAWDECVRPTLLAKQPPALFIFTPKGMNQAYELWAQTLNGNEDYKGFHYTSYDGPVPKEAIDAEAATMPEGVKRQEIYAEFLDDLGGVFRGISECVAGDREEPESGEQYVVGCDLGKTQDFTVVCVMKRSSRALVHFERFGKLDWELQIATVGAIAKRYNDAPALIDSTGLGDPVFDRFKSLGVPVKGYKFTNESKRKLIENLSIAISQKTIRYPDIPELVNELNIFQAVQLPSGGVRYEAPTGYHDDAVMALALACWELAHSIQIDDFTPVMGRERMTLPAGPF
jgi:hypothetical protein